MVMRINFRLTNNYQTNNIYNFYLLSIIPQNLCEVLFTIDNHAFLCFNHYNCSLTNKP